MPEFWKQVGEFLGCDMSSSTVADSTDQAVADSEAISEGGRIHVNVKVGLFLSLLTATHGTLSEGLSCALYSSTHVMLAHGWRCLVTCVIRAGHPRAGPVAHHAGTLCDHSALEGRVKSDRQHMLSCRRAVGG